MNDHILSPHLDLWQKTSNWQPSPELLQQWQNLYQEILEINSFLNLTRITSSEEFWEKNLWDSLAPIADYNLQDKKIIDIGTGGGFPGLPIALAFPNAKLILMDSITKKINFINNYCAKYQLNNVETLVDRAEVIGQNINHREQYDFVTIRAVASVSICLEYSLPLLKIGGISILYRGNLSDEEKTTIQRVSHKLGGRILKIKNQNTPINNNTRHCIYIEKIKNTHKKYPRQIGLPTKNPLS